MMYNLDKICSGENIEPIENEDFALEGYTLEIIKMLKRKQQNGVNRENSGEEKSIEEEEGRKKRRKENLEEEEESMRKELEQELQKGEGEMDEKIVEKTRKRKEREEKEKEDKHTKRPKSITIKRTRQQQEREYPEEQQEERKLRSGKIRKVNPVERSLSSRCRDAPD